MAPMKKVAAKRQAWNKDLEVGKRDGFTPAHVKRIRGLLTDRGVLGLRDLALFTTAIDTMLHPQDLLSLRVGDVQSRNGSIRSIIEVARARGISPVRCALSKVTAKTLEKWIAASGKKRTDYLFQALHILKGTGDLQTVRVLLGHARIESTARYLGLKTKADPITVCRSFDI